MTFSRAPSSRSTLARFLKFRTLNASTARDRIGSHSHGHDDGQEMLLATRTNHGGIQLTPEAELDLFILERPEHVQEILGIETDGHAWAAVFDRNFVEPFAAVRRFRSQAHRVLAHRQLHASRALACRDGDGPQRVGKSHSGHSYDFVALLRDHLAVRRKLRVHESNGKSHPASLEIGARATLSNLQRRLRCRILATVLCVPDKVVAK